MITPTYVAIDRLSSGRPYIRGLMGGEPGIRFDRGLRLLGHLTRRWEARQED